MKKILLFVFCVPFLINAQVSLSIEEKEQGMSKGTQPSFVIDIPKVDLKTVTKDFSKYIKKGSKGKVEEKGGEVVLIGAANSEVSPLPFNIFARFVQSPKGVQLSAWISEGETFVGDKTAASKAAAFKNYIRKFAVEAYTEAVKEELKAEESKLKDEKKKLEDFQKDEKKAESNIQSHKAEIASREKKIKEEEQNIEIAKNNQQSQKGAVASQEEVVNVVKKKMNGIR
jgi:hypothetical protein